MAKSIAPDASSTDEHAKGWAGLLNVASGHVPAAADAASRSPLWSIYGPIAQGNARPAFVVAQLGQALDGRIATPTGKSRYINCPDAIAHLHRLRALVDAVVVGVGTAIADDPQLSVREVEGPSPARVVIDPNFRMPDGLRLLRDGGAPVLAVQGRPGERPEGVTPVVVAPHAGRLAPRDIVAALAERGFKRILIEGGACTVSSFLAAGAVDRLHLSVAPVLIGSGPTGVNLPAIDELSDALRPEVTVHRLGSDVLYDCRFKGG